MLDSFGLAGYLVIAVYLLATIVLGLSFARKQKNLEGYFLAERAAPWWAVGISIVACDLSAISYMGYPSWAFYHDLRFAIYIFFVPFYVVIVAYLFVPFLARLKAWACKESCVS